MSRKFWKTYRIIMLILSVLLLLVLIVLWTFLSLFEKSQPKYVIENIISKMEKKDYSFLYKDNNISKENQKIINDEINNIINGELKYSKSVSANDNEQEYIIKIDNKKIASVFLQKNSKKNLFNLTKWDVYLIDGLIPPAKTIYVYAPEDVDVKVNNKLINKDSFISADTLRNDLLNSSKHTSINFLNKYEIKDIYDLPTVMCVNKNKEYLAVHNNDYYCDYPGDEELFESQKDYLINLSKLYTTYVVKENNFYSIEKHVISSSSAYSFLKNVSTTNIWLANHTKTEFSEFTFSNFQKYNEDFYSVKVIFSYHFFVDDKEFNYPTTLTFYMLKVNNEYFIVDLMTI